MTKVLQPVFNFNAAKQFCEIVATQIEMSSLEGNLFSHSRNPLLNMCLLYELMLGVKKKFFSLST